MSDKMLAYRVVRACGIRYYFEIDPLAGELTPEQQEAYRAVFKLVANDVIGEYEADIRSLDEVEPRTVYGNAQTPNVIVRIRLSTVRDVPEELLAKMAETIVTGFGHLVGFAVNLVALGVLGIPNSIEHATTLAVANMLSCGSGDMNVATAAYDAFVEGAVAAGLVKDGDISS